MIHQEFVRNFVFTNFTHVKETEKGTHWNFRCPFCGDSKKKQSLKRFHVFWGQGVPFFKCYNGGCIPGHGNFYTLYAHIKGCSYSNAKEEIHNRFDPKEILEKLTQKPFFQIQSNIENETFNDILNDCIDETSIYDSIYLTNLQKAIKKFRLERHADARIKLFASYQGKFKNRIIIPVFDEHENIVYFQGRSIVDSLQPKYLNPPAPKNHIILNKQFIDPDRYIILTEGILDSISCSNGIPVLGVSLFLDNVFIKNVFDLTNMGIIVATDNDQAGNDTKNKILNESRYKERLMYFSFPKNITCKDINSFIQETKLSEREVYEFIVKHSNTFMMEKIKNGIGG